MKLARRPRTWFGEEDDIVTAEIYLLRALLQSPVITVPQTAPLADVHRMLVDERVPAIIVVDDERTLLGLITRTDVLRVLLDEPDALAAEAMSRFVVAIPTRRSRPRRR
jgi:CBS domain-containing protein